VGLQPPTLAEPVELGNFLAMKLPARRWLLSGLLQERDLAMVHAFRGVGKSRFAHSLAVAVAAGGRFLSYEAKEPRGVLLVDGELPREDLQLYLAQAVQVSAKEPAAPLQVLSADLSGAPLRSLATPEGRSQIESHLEGVSLLILDAITTLCPGAGPENDSESWDQMQEWLLELRREGLTVLLVHHDGKGGSQRGTSKREDVLSQVVQLKRPSDYKASEGARFEVHLTKSRGIVGQAAEPYEAWLTTGKSGGLVWTQQSIEDATAAAAHGLAAEGLTQRDIAKELGMSLGSVNRALGRAKRAQEASI
jgi:putative DNA primase/helicase